MTSRNLLKFPTFDADSKALNIIIEAPKGSRVKYNYNEQHDIFQFNKLLPTGLFFPFDFGFLPSTRGGDGDPLDVVVLTDEPTFVGCLVLGHVLGVIEAEQTEKGRTNRNDRLLAIPISLKSTQPQSSATELDDKMGAQIRDFFVAYNKMQGKTFTPLNTLREDAAMRLIHDAMARAREKNSQ